MMAGNGLFVITMLIINSLLYINEGDGEEDTDEAVEAPSTDIEQQQRSISKGERSHLIVWQVTVPDKDN